MCGAPGAPRFSPREGKGCRSGSLEGTGIPSLCRRARRTGKPRPDAESAKVRACPGALREHRASRGKLAARVLGRPALVWAPRERGARCGGCRPPLWGRVLLGSGPPLIHAAGQGLEEGKKRVDSFLMEKKKKIWAVVPGLSLPPRPLQPSQQILSEESAPPPGISAAGTLPRRGRAGGEAEESSTCHFLRL